MTRFLVIVCLSDAGGSLTHSLACLLACVQAISYYRQWTELLRADSESDSGGRGERRPSLNAFSKHKYTIKQSSRLSF